MGFDSVLGDLAGIGYVGSWCSVRASDVGAPHRRERVFILATDAHADHAAI
ncbi:DNA cytosine methyltransferase, partial [Acinetobacter schindleri]|uniref:DNA cytosine methyltransferase n=1 Tax=Acinetobacter schindleri TaxID=108981 RepID=UPI003BF547C0